MRYKLGKNSDGCKTMLMLRRSYRKTAISVLKRPFVT